jgi:DNA-binding transcriptional ArsR family regulator
VREKEKSVEELGEMPWDEQEFALEEDEFWQMRQMFKAMGVERRLEIVELIFSGSGGVADIASALDMSVSLASHHLSSLKQAGLVEFEAHGTTRLYTLTPLARAILKTVSDGITAGRKPTSRRS